MLRQVWLLLFCLLLWLWIEFCPAPPTPATAFCCCSMSSQQTCGNYGMAVGCGRQCSAGIAHLLGKLQANLLQQLHLRLLSMRLRATARTLVSAACYVLVARHQASLLRC